MVEVVVGVDDVLDGLVGQGLGYGADVARAVAAGQCLGESLLPDSLAVHDGMVLLSRFDSANDSK